MSQLNHNNEKRDFAIITEQHRKLGIYQTVNRFQERENLGPDINPN